MKSVQFLPKGRRSSCNIKYCFLFLIIILVLSAFFRDSTTQNETPYEIEPYLFTAKGEITSRVHFGPLHWHDLPEHTQKEMTMDGLLPFREEWFNETTAPGAVRTWHKDEMESYQKSAREGQCRGSYMESCDMIVHAFEKFPATNKDVLVIGSQSPWIEAIALNAGAKSVSTCDFQKPKDNIHDERFHILSFSEVKLSSYDIIASYSSLEHDGLGRYGDPIHPNGDILRMKAIAALLKPCGLVFLGLPVGEDALSFNAGRIYGKVRLEKMMEGFKKVGYFTAKKFPVSLEEFLEKPLVPLFSWENQPLIVLQKKEYFMCNY